MLYKAILSVIKFFDDYSSRIYLAKYKTVHKGVKIITPKQILQIRPIAFAEVKAGNTSENLLNLLNQIICFVYRAKKLLKKYITI